MKYGTALFFCLCISITAVIGINIQPAHAGFFSDITSFFTGWGNSTKVDAPNSQQMPILQAPINSGDVQVLGTSTQSANAALLSSLYEQTVKANEAISSPTSSSPSSYVVASGDTLWKIANTFNITLNTLLTANHLTKKSFIHIGEKLIIPTSGVTPTTNTGVNTSTAPSSSIQTNAQSVSPTTYTVHSGDTLFSISKKYGVSVTAIKSANGMKKDTIFIGEKITIPSLIQVKDSVSYSAPVSSLPAAPALATKITSAVIMIPASAHKIFSPDGYYMRPIVGGYKSQGIHSHNAVDLADTCGTPIYASASGTVVISKDNGDWNGGYGNYVEIDHPNKTQTLYAHMQTVIVSVNQAVVQGQEIGTIGNTGDVVKEGGTGCHVHFEIHNNGYANPF